jgi:hypothetical protein
MCDIINFKKPLSTRSKQEISSNFAQFGDEQFWFHQSPQIFNKFDISIFKSEFEFETACVDFRSYLMFIVFYSFEPWNQI